MRVFYQWDNGKVYLTNSCSPTLGCGYAYHNKGDRGVYWAWDRALGAWVHYVK